MFDHGIAAHGFETPFAPGFVVPSDVLIDNKPTQYTLIGRVNTNPNGRFIPESSYDNNTTVGPTLTFVPAKLDLQLFIASVPKFLSRTDRNKISVIIKNKGNIWANGRAMLRLFHTHNRHLVRALRKALVTKSQMLTLLPGESRRVTLSLRSGGWRTSDFLSVTLDWKGDLPDQKPANNSVFSSTRIPFG